MARVEAGLFMIEVDYTSTSHAWIEPQKSSPFELGLDWTVALDKQGNLAAGTSTGGLTNKRFGRVGDTPIIGAGNYADNETCAVSGTGQGEFFMRLMIAGDVVLPGSLHEEDEGTVTQVEGRVMNVSARVSGHVVNRTRLRGVASAEWRRSPEQRVAGWVDAQVAPYVGSLPWSRVPGPPPAARTERRRGGHPRAHQGRGQADRAAGPSAGLTRGGLRCRSRGAARPRRAPGGARGRAPHAPGAGRTSSSPRPRRDRSRARPS